MNDSPPHAALSPTPPEGVEYQAQWRYTRDQTGPRGMIIERTEHIHVTCMASSPEGAAVVSAAAARKEFARERVASSVHQNSLRFTQALTREEVAAREKWLQQSKEADARLWRRFGFWYLVIGVVVIGGLTWLSIAASRAH